MKSRWKQLSLFGNQNVDKNTHKGDNFKVVSIHKNDNEQLKRRKEVYSKFLSLSDHLDKL